MKRLEYPALGETVFAGRLPCGLELRVVQKRGFARVNAFLAVDFGSIDTDFTFEGARRRVPDGIAHYLEHKMFDLPEGNAGNRFSESGAYSNAFTSYGMTAYYFSCTEETEQNLRLLLRMVLTPYFTAESVEKERGIIEQEIRMYEDSADSRAGEELNRCLYASHPLRVPIAGTVESIAAITPELLTLCHRAFYQPANMMLCVVGDVDPERIAAIVADCVPQTEAALPVRHYGGGETLLPVTRERLLRMEVSMPTFSAGFKCPPPERTGDPMRQEVLCELASELLCGESSPLYARLYEANLIDSDFSAGYESTRHAALFSASGDSRDPRAVLDALLAEAQRIAREGVDRTRFERLKKSSIGRRTRDLDGFDSISYRICAYHFDGADYLTFPRAYERVTPEEIQDFLAQTVVPERAALCIVEPRRDAT